MLAEKHTALADDLAYMGWNCILVWVILNRFHTRRNPYSLGLLV